MISSRHFDILLGARQTSLIFYISVALLLYLHVDIYKGCFLGFRWPWMTQFVLKNSQSAGPLEGHSFDLQEIPSR